MKRITLTETTARLIEQQLSAYEDTRDERGKPLREPKERRQWDRMADQFLEAAAASDALIEAVREQGKAWGTGIFAERSEVLEKLTADWKREVPDPEQVTQAVDAIKAAYQMRIDGQEHALSLAMTAIEDGPIGTASCAVDLDDTQIEFLTKTWPEIDLNTTKRVRRLTNAVTDALAGAVELVREGDRYVPKVTRPTLVEQAG